jgi:hypothetical protein
MAMKATNDRLWLKLAFSALLASILFALPGSRLTVLAAPSFAPALTITPSSGAAGSTVTLHGSGFTSGPGTALWDGVPQMSISIPAGGSFNVTINVPSGAAPGPHTVGACGGSPCNTGEFAENASAVFTVTEEEITDTPRPAGLVDYQIIALEVTQGVRGDIPRRIPDGSLTLLDDALHVANRRTVVRAFPYAYFLPGASNQPVTAYLQYRRDSVWSAPIYPGTRYLRPSPSWSYDMIRRAASFSYNFILPAEAYQAGTTNLRVVINPDDSDHILECAGCGSNNMVSLNDVAFRTVQTRDVEMRVIVTDFAYRDSGGNAVNFMPSIPELAEAINYMIKVWPIDPSRIRVSYQYTRISQAPPPYSDTQPRLVIPPIRGYRQWDNQVYIDANLDIYNNPQVFRRPPYSFAWLAFDSNSWMGCSGNAGLGYTPLFHAGACGPTLAQEAAHSISVSHAGNSHGEEAGGGFNPDYPGFHGQVEANAFGFDVWNMQVIPPDIGEHTHDYMSYGGNAWTSIYTWEQIAGLFGAADIEVGSVPVALRIPAPGGRPTAQAANAYLRIAGDIVDGKTVYLSPVFTVEAPAGSGDGTGQGSYTLELQDATGGTLFERAFEPYPISEEGLFSFYELVPVVDGLARVVISTGGKSIGVLSAPGSAPQVSLLSPVSGDHWTADGDQLVTWQGSDPDGDALTYRVQASADGQTWETISGATTETEALIHLAYLPGSGQNWRIRVQASDGLHVASAEAQGITIDAKPPIPMIVTPLDKNFFGTGQTVDVMGQAYDYIDGAVPGESLEWLVDGKVVAKGGSASLSGLKTGEHTLGLRATNSAGLQGITEIKITLGPDLDQDGLPDDWEKQADLDSKDPNDAADDKDADGYLNWQEYALGSNPSDPADPHEESHGDHIGPSGSRLAESVDPLAAATAGAGQAESPAAGQGDQADPQQPAAAAKPLSIVPLVIAILAVILLIVLLVVFVFLRRARRP